MLKDTAVVLIECQNEFCSAEGALHGAVKDVLTQNNVLENVKSLLERVEGKCKVIHVPITFQKGYPEVSENPYGIMKGVVEANAFEKDSQGADFFFSPKEGDIVAEGKKTLCAFASSNLDSILRANNVKKVAFAGFLTNVCVEASARSAYDKGYEVYILSDCTAATSMEEQQFAVNKIFPLFAHVMTQEEFVNAVVEGKETSSAGGRAYYN